MATFISDSDSAVQSLIDACQKPRASLEAPCLPHLLYRELQPYDFGGTENPLDAGKPTKRKGSPQHAQGRPRSSPKAQTHANGKGIANSKKVASSTGGSSSSESEVEACTPPRRNIVRKASPLVSHAPQQHFAIPMCPGSFRASPKAETLPLPSSTLLMRACLQPVAPLRLAVVA